MPKASTVLSMPRPHGKAAIRRFLGAITYLSKFCSRLSEVVRPLRDLTHLNQEFLWADQHTEALRHGIKGWMSLNTALVSHCQRSKLRPFWSPWRVKIFGD